MINKQYCSNNHPAFKRVVLMGRRRASMVPETVTKLRDYLKNFDLKLMLEKHTGMAINEAKLPLIDSHELRDNADLIILVGGDGSMINAAHIAVSQGLPILGINRGRLGFLTDIHPDELEKISEVLAGKYCVDPRFVLNAKFIENGQVVRERLALNDVVLLQGDYVHMIDFELKINDDFICKQRADGMIISTPTGSTAYSLSAGGPILQPELEALALVPMFPHTLTSRPIVIPASEKIQMLISEDNESHVYVSTDGQDKMPLAPGGMIEISKHDQYLQLVHPKDYDYFDTLRHKLGWNHYQARS